jgi:hypothetical protein
MPGHLGFSAGQVSRASLVGERQVIASERQDRPQLFKPADDPRRMVAGLADGLQLVVTGVGEPAEGRVQISAEATNDATREKANAIAAKVEGYDFRLPVARAELLGWTNVELTNGQKS